MYRPGKDFILNYIVILAFFLSYHYCIFTGAFFKDMYLIFAFKKTMITFYINFRYPSGNTSENKLFIDVS